jgi:hypothetical protein
MEEDQRETGDQVTQHLFGEKKYWQHIFALFSCSQPTNNIFSHIKSVSTISQPAVL